MVALAGWWITPTYTPIGELFMLYDGTIKDLIGENGINDSYWAGEISNRMEDFMAEHESHFRLLLTRG
jgi:hypothetical protein